MPTVKNRVDDEALLTMLRWRDEGYSTTKIGNAVGLTSSRVRTLTNRVIADLEASNADA